MSKIKKITIAVFITVSVFVFQNVLGQELSKTDKKEYRLAEKERQYSNFKQSLEIFQKLAKKYPQNVDILYGTANSSYKLKDYDIAINYYNTLSVILDRKVDDLRFKPKKSNKEKKEYLKLRDLKKIVKNEYESCKSLRTEFALLNSSERKNDLKKTYKDFKKEDDRINNSSNVEPVENNSNQSQPVEDHFRPTFSTSTSNSDNDTKSTETNFVSNKNTAYSACISPGFIPLNSRNSKDQIDDIKKEVLTIYDSLRTHKSQYIAKYEDIIRTSHEWTKENALKQYEWFEELKNKEDKYRLILDGYNDLYNERLKIENDLKLAINDSLVIAEKIDSFRTDSARLSNIMNVTLKDDLKSKLSTIPRSIVLVGRIKHEKSQNADDRVEHLMTTMNQMAIKKVNGHKILNAKLTENDNLSGLYEMTTEGIAQTADKYYKSLRKHLDDEDIDAIYTYQIYRIEVFPFNDNEKYWEKNEHSSSYTKSKLTLSDIDVYEVSNNGVSFVKLLERDDDYYVGTTTTAEDHQFKEEELRFIEMIKITSDKFNQEYDKKIEEAIERYHKDYNEKKSKISSFSDKTYPLTIEMNQVIRDIESLRNLFNNNDLKRENTFHNEYTYAKNEYEDFYSQKYQFINQLEIHNIENFNTYSEGFEEIAKKSYKAALENMSKLYNRTTIYKESVEGGNMLNLAEVQIEYEPVICSYKILRLGKYSSSDFTYLALNIAFQVQWTLDGELIIDKPGEVIVTQPVTIPEEFGKTPEGKSYGGSSQTSWQIFSKGPSSILEYSFEKKDNNWQQSSYQELVTLFSKPDNIDLLKNLTHKENGEFILVSGDSGKNDDYIEVYKGLKITVETLGEVTQNKVEISDGETAYIILIGK